jgi:hypothetical protein
MMMSLVSQLHLFFARPAAEKTFSTLISGMTGNTNAFLALFLLLPAALPLPTGGITHLLEIFAIALGFVMMLGRDTISLKAAFFHRPVVLFNNPNCEKYTMKTVLFFQRWSRWKSPKVMNTETARRVTGLGVVVFSLSAFVAVPFTGLDTLPALGVVAMAFGLILEDVGIWVVGLLVGLLGTVINLALLVKLSQEIYHIIVTFLS